MVDKLIKSIIILIVSIGIGYVLTLVAAESSSAIRNSALPFALWGVFTVISAVILRRVTSRGGGSGRDAWGSPEQSRDRVVSSPQFVGRFDRSRGLLDSTARMIDYDSTAFFTYIYHHGL